MSEQNRYNISYRWRVTASYWHACGVWPGDTWKEAIHNWIKSWDEDLGDLPYTVLSEKPSEDGRSGTMDIKEDVDQGGVYTAKASIIEDN